LQEGAARDQTLPEAESRLKQLMQEETGHPVQGYFFYPEEQAMALLRGDDIIYIDAN
jgi:hypothetical protein